MCNSIVVCVFSLFIQIVQQYLQQCESNILTQRKSQHKIRNITHQCIFKSFLTGLSCCFHNIWLILQICEQNHLIAGNVIRILMQSAVYNTRKVT